LQGGKYRIERVLGQGGFGITYLAVQTSLERNVAIKEFFMKDFCSRDNTMLTTGSTKLVEQCRKKFVKEARNLARLSHPNIIGVIDIFEENETVYYVMPYLTGGSLEDHVKKHGTLSESEAMKYVRQIASALKYMHEEQHICHYDVKPANILLDKKGNAVLIDFGISKNYDANGHETTTTPIGMSEGYAPIEQYQQNVEEFSPVSDVYALGATLYFLLHGKRPVSAVHRASGTELSISEQLSQEIKDLINDSMNVSKQERVKSVDVFLKGGSFPEQRINSTIDSAAKDEETLIASEGNEDIPFEILLKLAEEGDIDAQFCLGYCYDKGEGIEEDKQEAYKWYKKAAKEGNASARGALNNMKLEDYEEFPLINEALAGCNYYRWERARKISGIIGGGFLFLFFIGLFLLDSIEKYSFLSFIDDIPTYCVVIFFIIFNPITTIFLANIIDGFIESNQKAILDAVLDGLEIEVPYPVREEFTDRERIV